MAAASTDPIATLADPTRRQIFEIVSTGPHSVVEIARQLPVTRPAVSQHLAVLSRAGLVTHDTIGTKHVYRLDPRGITEIRNQLDQLWERALAGFEAAAERASKWEEQAMTVTTPQDRLASEIAVRKTVEVVASQADAFAVFTERFGEWWPLQTHHIGTAPAQSAILEPRRGGRWYERGVDGSECDWGQVLEWDPPHRLVLAWQISADWKHDPNLSTEVEVRFVPLGPQKTRVELAHRQLERFGEKAGMMQSIFDSESGGWTGILQRYANMAGSSASGS